MIAVFPLRRVARGSWAQDTPDAGRIATPRQDREAVYQSCDTEPQPRDSAPRRGRTLVLGG
jgi:hypothetical protein